MKTRGNEKSRGERFYKRCQQSQISYG